MTALRSWTAIAAVAAALALVYAAGRGVAGDGKGMRGEVEKIAAALKKGDMDSAKSMAEAVGKSVKADSRDDKLEELMDLYKPKKKGGIAWTGAKDTDGIELKVREVARDGPKNIAKDAAVMEEVAYTTAAIGLITEAMPPATDSAKKTKKNWLDFSKQVHEGAVALAKAAQSKSAAEIKTATTKVNNACNACHADFRN
jgi:hypothetical protein